MVNMLNKRKPKHSKAVRQAKRMKKYTVGGSNVLVYVGLATVLMVAVAMVGVAGFGMVASWLRDYIVDAGPAVPPERKVYRSVSYTAFKSKYEFRYPLLFESQMDEVARSEARELLESKGKSKIKVWTKNQDRSRSQRQENSGLAVETAIKLGGTSGFSSSYVPPLLNATSADGRAYELTLEEDSLGGGGGEGAKYLSGSLEGEEWTFLRPVPPPHLDSFLSLAANHSGQHFQVSPCFVSDLLWGERLWFVQRPGVSKAVGAGYNPDMPIRYWLEHESINLVGDERPIEILQRAGEALYVPQGLSHAFVSVGGDSGAVTHRRTRPAEGGEGGAASRFYAELVALEAAVAGQRWDEAVEGATRALQLAPGNYEALLLRGDAVRGRGEARRALATYREAALKNTRSPRALERQIDVYLGAGDYEGAGRVLENAVEAAVDSPRLRSQRVSVEKGKRDTLKSRSKRARRHQPWYKRLF